MLARILILTTVGVVVVTAVGGCALLPNAGPPVTREQRVGEASAVMLRTSGDLVVTRGDAASLTTTASEGVFEALTFEVVDGVLVLDSDGPMMPGLGRVRYELTLPELGSVGVEGSGDVEADFSGAREVEIDVRGSGDVTGSALEADSVAVSVSGSGDVRLDGETDEQSVTIRGSGDYLGRGLTSDTATISIAGSGDAEVHARDTLDVSIAGSGSVRHTGGARVDSDVAGSGDVSEF
jgi:hypothetical protein